jgi:hypothetical protein
MKLDRAKREGRREGAFWPSSDSLYRRSVRRPGEWVPRFFIGGWVVGLVFALLVLSIALDSNLHGEFRDEETGVLHWGELLKLFLLAWIPASFVTGGALVLLRAIWGGLSALHGPGAGEDLDLPPAGRDPQEGPSR